MSTCETCTRYSTRLKKCRLVAFFTMQPDIEIPFTFEHDGNPQTYREPQGIAGQGWAKFIDDDTGTQQLTLAHAANNHRAGIGPLDCPAHVAAHSPTIDPVVDVAALASNAWLFAAGGGR